MHKRRKLSGGVSDFGNSLVRSREANSAFRLSPAQYHDEKLAMGQSGMNKLKLEFASRLRTNEFLIVMGH